MIWLMSGFALLIIAAAVNIAAIWRVKSRPTNRGLGFLIAGLLVALCGIAWVVLVLAFVDLTR
jgi:hypothetical protein